VTGKNYDGPYCFFTERGFNWNISEYWRGKKEPEGEPSRVNIAAGFNPYCRIWYPLLFSAAASSGTGSLQVYSSGTTGFYLRV
jgi:hypothetical protein